MNFWQSLLGGLAIVAAVSPGRSADPVTLAEHLSAGASYHVSTRSSLKGRLEVPVDEKAPSKTVELSGNATIEYDERLLTDLAADQEQRTLRIYQKAEVKRVVGDRPQSATIRSNVSRWVITRRGGKQNGFSPDGPLTWEELELIRSEVFFPALAKFLPGTAVAPNGTWKIPTTAILDSHVTDLVTIDKGELTGRFEEVRDQGGRPHAQITLTGTLEGVNDDGPARHQIKGTMYFDVTRREVVYLSVSGTLELLDPSGKVKGTIEGSYTSTRSAVARPDDISSATLAKIKTEPSPETSQMLYMNDELGLELVHSRRWRVESVRGRQVTFSEENGRSILMTVDAAADIPTPAAFQREAERELIKQGGTVVLLDREAKLKADRGELSSFAFAVTQDQTAVSYRYFVTKQDGGGATFASQLFGSDAAELSGEVEAVARSLKIVRPLKR